MKIASLMNSFKEELKRHGLRVACGRAVNYFSPESRAYRKNYKSMLQISDPKKRFTEIYEKNLWQDPESQSGSGSTLRTTQNLRNQLPKLIDKYQIKTILDIPCGDFHWMRLVTEICDNINYTGADIVETLIEQNARKFESNRVKFRVMDLTSDDLLPVDLIIVRDCLFHLSFKDVMRVKANLKRSKATFILTTTHRVTSGFRNQDIVTGDFRKIDIFSEPFLFPATPLERIEDFVFPEHERDMCLFRIADL